MFTDTLLNVRVLHQKRSEEKVHILVNYQLPAYSAVKSVQFDCRGASIDQIQIDRIG